MIFTKFDLIGGSIGFNYGKAGFTTILGGIFTFILVTVLSLLIAVFGRDFYKRINPSFIKQTIFADKPPVYTINNKNFTIAAKFEDDYGNMINRSDAFYVDVEYISNVRNDKDGWDVKIEILNLTQCSEELFHSKENFESGSYDLWMCPILNNLKFGGSFAYDFASTIKLNYYFCPEGQINPYTKQKCVTNKELMKISENLVYMDLASQLPFVTPGDYNSGLKTKVLYNWYVLDFKYHKLVYTYFLNYTMLTDYGWIFENEIKDSYLVMNKMNLDFIEVKNVFPNNKLGTFWLYSDTDNGIELFKRKYVKIQQLAAEVGGLMNFMFTVGGIIIHSYNNQKYYNKLFSFYYQNDQKENIINDQISMISILKKTNYKNIVQDHNEKSELKDQPKSHKNLDDLLMINSIDKNLSLNKNINDSIYSFNSSKLNENDDRIKNNIYNYSKDNRENLEKLTKIFEDFKLDITPEISYLRNLKESTKKNNNIISVFSSKSKDEEYINTIEKESYNFFTFMFAKIFCSCSKKYSRKINFISNLQANFLDKMDIREYLRINFELERIKKVLFDDKFNDSANMKDEQCKYIDFVKKFNLSYDN